MFGWGLEGMVWEDAGRTAAQSEGVWESRPDSPLCRSALIEWHILSRREKAERDSRQLSYSSGISTSTTRTSCVREDDPAVAPPLVQTTSLSDESRIKMQISRKELQERANGRAGLLSGEESNSSFASQSSVDHHQAPRAPPSGSEDCEAEAERFGLAAMKRAVITSAEGAGPHFEAIDVIRAMADLAAHSRAAMRDVFDHFDRDKDGVLDREDLLLMIRQLIPSLSVQERCYLIENLVSFGNPAGRVTYQDIKRICVLIGAQTSPMGSGKAIRGWPSAVHTSVATIHSSDFSKSGSCAQTNSKVSSYSQSSFETNAWGAPRPAAPDAEDAAALPSSPEEPPRGSHRRCQERVTPLNKARRRSSLMLGDALLRVSLQDDDDDDDAGGVAGGLAVPREVQQDGSPPESRLGLTSARPRQGGEEEEAAGSRMQTFLGSAGGEMKLMARGELPAVLKEVFSKIYADGSDFLHLSSSSGMSMDISKWCKSFVHGGYIRTIKLVTTHPKLGKLQTLDTQRMVWGKDKKTLVVENRTMTPDFPNGLQWRVERRCVYTQVSPGVVLLTITAGVFVIHPFHKAGQLQKAVERTLPEDARSHFQAIYNTILLDKIVM